MTDTIDHDARSLWVTDAELIRRMGVPEKIARATIREMDRLPSGFPPKEALWGNRRYWPAVRAFLDHQYDRMNFQGRRTQP